MDSYIDTEGGGLTKDEAAGIASIRDLLAWAPIVRILESMRSDDVSRVMDAKTTPDAAAFHRGRYQALSDVQAMLGKTIPEAYLAKLSVESGRVSTTEADPDGR